MRLQTNRCLVVRIGLARVVVRNLLARFMRRQWRARVVPMVTGIFHFNQFPREL